jgi:hypothetical protein
MFKNTFSSILQTIRELISNRGSLAIFAGLYALLLAALYGFIATREATIWQVLLTLLFVASAPVLFFVLQATIIDRARADRIEWYRALRDSCKLALLALPVILIGLGVFWLLNRWQAHFPAPHMSVTATGAPQRPPTHWPTILFATSRVLIFWIVLPLALIHLWVEVASTDLIAFVRSGARAMLKRLGHIFSQAFAPQSLLVYSLGLIVFALIPYVLLFVRMPLKGTKSEIGVFTVRLALVFVFTFLGWVITLSTFARKRESLEIQTASDVKASE